MSATLIPSGMTPERSLTQRMDALQRANDVRSYRAQLKRELGSNRHRVMDVLTNPPAETSTMKVFDLLLATPKLGRVKVQRILAQARISPTKTIGGLSSRQREELLTIVRQRVPPTRVI